MMYKAFQSTPTGRRPLASAFVIGAFVFLCFLCPAPACAYDTDDCVRCHSEIDMAAFAQSVHYGQAECSDCHTGVIDENHIKTKGSGAVDCGQCHDQVNDHGLRGAPETRPSCDACHTRHGILPKTDPGSSIHPGRLEQTCGRCHAAQAGRPDYWSWLPSIRIGTHGKADMAGRYTKDNCIGCHQGRAVHGESEVLDDAACHRCHLTAEGENALLGRFHARADLHRQPGIWTAGLVYHIFMLGLLGAGVAYWVGRLSAGPRS